MVSLLRRMARQRLGSHRKLTGESSLRRALARRCRRIELGAGCVMSSCPTLAADSSVWPCHLSDEALGHSNERMSLTRREALARLSALLAIPLVRWPERLADPLAGTIVEYQAGRARRDWTAAEVTARALERCTAWNATLHAIDQLSGTALDEARASDARAHRGALRGPLDGVPVFAKSIYDMNGLTTTASSAEWARLFPLPVARDAIEVARMRAAGAVVLGKTVADDFAYRGNGTSSLSGQVRNPHDPTGTRTPGGSSAGSAVSVACGMAFAALGTDDGGSNRIPAQFCGIVGMKPTFGLVPRTGVIPTWPFLDTHGPLARSVADAALLLDAIAGPDSSDGLGLVAQWPSGRLALLRDDALVNARLGLVEAHVPRAQMTADALAVFDRAIANLSSAGAVVESCAPAVTRSTFRTLFTEAARTRGDVTPNANSPAATANALLRYFAGQSSDPRRDVERGLAAYRAFYDVLPTEWGIWRRSSINRTNAIQPGYPLRAPVKQSSRNSPTRFVCNGSTRWCTPRCPSLHRVPSIRGPTFARHSATGTGSGFRKCRYQPVSDPTACRPATFPSSDFPAAMRACSRSRMRMRSGRDGSSRRRCLCDSDSAAKRCRYSAESRDERARRGWPPALLELLPERLELRPQIRHFELKLAGEILECGDPVSGSNGSPNSGVLLPLVGIHNVSPQQMRISHFFLAWPAREAGGGRHRVTRNECFQRRLDALGIIAWHQPRCAASDFTQCLRATQHQYAEHGQLGS